MKIIKYIKKLKILYKKFELKNSRTKNLNYKIKKLINIEIKKLKNHVQRIRITKSKN